MIDPKYIRNFSIIAHIDHGKSTLADRLLEFTETTTKREMKAQILDSMDIERERGITIKSQAACINYKAKDGNIYHFNLIDTPGHVDFAYEVSRALAACEAVLLVVDASQGVEAQTLANMYQALEHDLEIIPVINKIDLPTADIDRVKKQIEVDLGLDSEHAVAISAKSGINIEGVLESIVQYCPPPKGSLESVNNPPKALIFDAYFDIHKGVIMSVRVMDGIFKVGDEVKFFQTNTTYKIEELGVYKIKQVPTKEIGVGEVGFVNANIKSLQDTKIGDTMTTAKNGCSEAYPGYKDVMPMVFAGIYPIDTSEYEQLQTAIEKLKLNDASLVFEPESSAALGFGFRCGFLGLLHMEIVQERFRREFNLELITTAPSVEYKVTFPNGRMEVIDNPTVFPDKHLYEFAEEPYVTANLITPEEYLGAVMQLAHEKRGIQGNINYFGDDKRVQVDFDIPLAEIVYDFHDKLKSVSRGYASYDYEITGYKRSDLVRVDILVNAQKVDAFSQIIHKDKATYKGRAIIEKLKDIIPRHMFQVPLQAAIGATIIARENIKALRKDVTSKCYGGDISRKRKLLEKQKEGKKKMRQVGSVEIPQEAFLTVLKV